MFCLPFYCRADKIRKEEEEKLLEMEPYINKIKRNFKGDEQFFMLKTLYRQHNYNPIMSIRNSLSLLLQIPFFIAAYHFFSNLDIVNGMSWRIFSDLSKPDMLISLNDLKINVLPIVMTIINILSCELYIKSKSIKARIQPYGFALIFLLLLYNSPAVLVLYWTFNNFFYLLKNKYMDENPKKFGWVLFAILITVFFLDGQRKLLDIQLLLSQLFNISYPLLIIYIIFKFIKDNYKSVDEKLKETSQDRIQNIFLICSIGLILLQGIIIPLGLVSSDLSLFVTELDNTGNMTNVLVDNLLHFIGLYLVWTGISLYLIDKKYRIYFIIIFLTVFLHSLFNYLSFGNNLGNIDIDFVFANKTIIEETFENIISQIFNVSIYFFILAIVIYLIKKSYVKQMTYIVVIILITELVVSGIGIVNYKKGINRLDSYNNELKKILANNIELSRTKKNVIIIFLDRFLGGCLPMILDEKPELKSLYSGFVFYPNTVSFYRSTVLGYPACIGGYEYTPYVLDRDKRHFSEKWLEANLMLPTLFKKEDYISTVVDPIGDSDDQIRFYKTENFSDIYTSRGLNYVKMAGRYDTKFQLNELEDNMILEKIKKKFYLYSFFNIAAYNTKSFIYDSGKYLLARTRDDIRGYYYSTKTFISAYSSLLYLKDITKFDSDKNTFTLINNDVPHNMQFLQYPKYEMIKNVTDVGPNRFKDEESFKCYHTTMAATLLVGEYLKYLKSSGVYDNSRIIIVSDHGNTFLNLPRYTLFQYRNVAPFNPVLMFKDFNQNFELKTDETFMTNADVPFLATSNLIENAKNPFTGKQISIDGKTNGAYVYMNNRYWNTSHFNSNRVILDEKPTIKHINGDIHNESNWKNVKYINGQLIFEE